jgi:hypothetical protein
MVCEILTKDVDFIDEQISEENREATSTEANSLGNFEVVVDEDTEPVDWDEAIASFLLAYVRKNQIEQTATGRRFPHEFSTN